MTHHFKAADMKPADTTSRLLELPTASPMTGDIMTRSQNLYTSDKGDIKMGTWECEPGQSRWEFTDRGEFIHVIDTLRKVFVIYAGQ